MPRIFDNIEQSLLPALQQTINVSEHSDFCVGYFNLRGWGKLDKLCDKWCGGPDHCCRLLVGMQKLPQEELRETLSLLENTGTVDAKGIIQLKKQMATEFRRQLLIGAPNNEDESALRHLVEQIRDKKVQVKLFLRYPLHAKLYLLYRDDFNNPISGYLGSSNLTLAGLSAQGELNIDVLDQDACKKLEKWFNDRWNDKWCLDISDELINIIDESWARKEPVPPYYVYLKMAYHLAQEARAGLSEFKLPVDFQNQLLEFQTAAVQIAAHHLNKRGGVLIGDVVGLGKTLMATAVARIFEDDFYLETLIICPKNLVKMWEGYVHKYRLRGKVLSSSRALSELSDLRRYRLVIIDESQNLRNREGKRYRAIQEYIKDNESKVILLSATPYNKTYLDLSAQLRLFVSEELDLGIKPERLIREIGEMEFIRRHQAPIRSIAAFEKSEYTDDWRDLMRLYMVRRTRSFIKDNYAFTDETNKRKYLLFADGTKSYFPDRVPKALQFKFDEKNPSDQYARLYSDRVVNIVNGLSLPRYGLGNYLLPEAEKNATPDEKRQMDNLSRAGKRLMGFCRTNLFKRLESSGESFLLSVDRHILRNYVYIHAIENNLPIPIGLQSTELFDLGANDEDVDSSQPGQVKLEFEDDNDDEKVVKNGSEQVHDFNESWYKNRAVQLYELYRTQESKKFKWIKPAFFDSHLGKLLLSDSRSLLQIMQEFGHWDAKADTKLTALFEELTNKHPIEKVLIFTQFADTVRYLKKELDKKGVKQLEDVTGQSEDPTDTAWRFSPTTNQVQKQGMPNPSEVIRVLISTDVLSEGQNLQDCAIVINYDLPWALVRLIQRIGRVDRIGQQSEKIYCYSALPADGLERIIHLRAKVRQRLSENGEVVGSDEIYFEDDLSKGKLKDLYTEKSGILEGEADNEVDLASFAYQIWRNAIKQDPSLERKIAELPDVVYSTKNYVPTEKEPAGVLVYAKTAEGNDSLVWMNTKGESVTQSQLSILKAADCPPETPAIPKDPRHHDLVRQGVKHIVQQEKTSGGQLGRPSGARYRTYDRLKRYYDDLKKNQPLFARDELERAIDDIYRFPLRSSATDILNRQLRTGVSDDNLAELVIDLRSEDRLSIREEEIEQQEPRIICSLGLFQKE